MPAFSPSSENSPYRSGLPPHRIRPSPLARLLRRSSRGGKPDPQGGSKLGFRKCAAQQTGRTHTNFPSSEKLDTPTKKSTHLSRPY